MSKASLLLLVLYNDFFIRSTRRHVVLKQASWTSILERLCMYLPITGVRIDREGIAMLFKLAYKGKHRAVFAFVLAVVRLRLLMYPWCRLMIP